MSLRDDDIFQDALVRAPEQRAAFLAEACARNPAQRARVDALLANIDGAARFFRTEARVPLVLPPDKKASEQIGRYKLLEKIGEGGCGVVWMAEQEEPVRRRVALKVIKLGMDTREVIARFEAERQALAMMDHPNIAKVFDAGTTEAGRPFFVMELVRGVPITRYCDEQNLSTTARLELFIDVCHAIQHAHQKGIIHRDIKPSNVLVARHDDVAVAKVIDFGIAKATQGKLTDATVFTAFAQFIGTPAYMSPEQAELNALDVDTRSDVYSLGVLLYELLTGRPPFDPKSLLAAGVDEIRRIIREVEPPRPSTLAQSRTVGGALRPDSVGPSNRRDVKPLPQLAKAADLRGDLDWIVMKSLEKNRTRRYESASAFAADIQRHLRHEAVTARPPSTAYLLQKLVRRHRVVFGAAAAIGATLVLGAAISTWQAVRATRAEREKSGLLANESALRQRAEGAELATRRRAYVADMNLVQQALAADHWARAQDLLNRQRPKPGETDLRGWEWRYLWQFSQSDAMSSLATKPVSINSLAASADGAWLAAGEAAYGGLSVWNLRTREEIRIPAGRAAVKVLWSPTEPLLAIAVTAEEAPLSRVLLWDVPTRRVVRELVLAAAGQISGMSFSADGETLVASRSSQTNEIVRWRVADGQKLAAFPRSAAAMDGRFSSFAVNRDSTLAAYYTGIDRRVHVFDLRTGSDLWSAVAAEESLLSLAFSPDSKLLVSGCGWTESVIRMWDVATGAEAGRLEGNHRFVGHLVFWPDGKLLASGGGDHTVRIWDVASRKLVRTLRGHRSEVYALALLPDARTLVSGSKDGEILFWDGLTDRVQDAFLRFPGGPVAGTVRLAPTSDALVAVDHNGKLFERRGKNFQDYRVLLDLKSQGRVIVAARRPRVAIEDGRKLSVWDWERGALVREVALAPGELSLFPVAFVADDERLMLGRTRDAKTSVLEEWSLSEGRKLRDWPLPTSVPTPWLSPDARYFVVATTQGRYVRDLTAAAAGEPDAWIRVELANGKQTVLPGNTRESREAGAGFSPDGRWFVGGSALGFIDVIDVATWQKVTTLTGVMAGMYRPRFSADSQRLVVGSSGSEAVTIWDAVGFERLLTLPTGNSVTGIYGFSADDRLLVARSGGGSMDYSAAPVGGLFIWRAPSWEEIAAAEQERH